MQRFAASLIVLVWASGAYADDSPEDGAKKFIVDAGYWCSGQVTVAANKFWQDSAGPSLHAVCKDGEQIANYNLTLNPENGRVLVQKSWSKGIEQVDTN